MRRFASDASENGAGSDTQGVTGFWEEVRKCANLSFHLWNKGFNGVDLRREGQRRSEATNRAFRIAVFCLGRTRGRSKEGLAGSDGALRGGAEIRES